ncbi:MFS transporter [Thauera linaloolentis]|nr:MFS transporter [Thauera linaloolentis]
MPHLRKRLDADGLLLAGAAGLVGVGLAAHRIKLPAGEADLVPSNHWPEPLIALPVDNDRGPVLIQIEYRIAPQDRTEFLKALARLSAEPRRDGAYAWGIAEDSADPALMLEWFQVESWAEHLRQHKRVSRADADAQEDVCASTKASSARWCTISWPSPVRMKAWHEGDSWNAPRRHHLASWPAAFCQMARTEAFRPGIESLHFVFFRSRKRIGLL